MQEGRVSSSPLPAIKASPAEVFETTLLSTVQALHSREKSLYSVTDLSSAPKSKKQKREPAATDQLARSSDRDKGSEEQRPSEKQSKEQHSENKCVSYIFFLLPLSIVLEEVSLTLFFFFFIIQWGSSKAFHQLDIIESLE